MVKLGRAAQANPIFREISGTSSLTITRESSLPPYSWTSTFQNILNWIIDVPEFPEGNGVKSGWTPNAEITTVVSAQEPLGGDAVAGTFWTWKGNGVQIARQNAADVLRLGLAECGIISTILANENFQFYLTGASTWRDIVTAGTSQYGGALDGDVTVDFCRAEGAGPTSAEVRIRRTSEYSLPALAQEVHGIGPFFEHGDIRIHNQGTVPASIQVVLSYTTSPLQLIINPGQHATIPAYGGPDAMFTMTIGGRSPISLLAVEEDYGFDVLFPPGPCIAPALSALIPRSGRSVGDTFEIMVLGTDPNGGSTINAIVHDGEVTAVAEPVMVDAAAPGVSMRVASLAPNPLGAAAARTRLTFELFRDGMVEAAIFDVAGRRVRGFPGARLQRGRHVIEWDGRTDDGRRAPSGVYLYRLSLEGGEVLAGRVAVVR
jgi:hypothetical protein